MPLSSVVGHTYPCQVLAKWLEREPRAGSLIFCGPSGVGKGYVAALFAKALLGATCELSNHPDYLCLVPGSKTGQYQKDQIDQIRQFAQVSSTQSQIKVCVVEKAQALGINNTNALLKTVEEPAAPVLFIFITELEKAILPTLLSRSAVLHFSPTSLEEVENFLVVQEGADREKAQKVATSSMGRIGLAYNKYHGHEDKVDTLSFDLGCSLYEGDTLYAVDVCKKIEKEVVDKGITFEPFLERVYLFFKDCFLLSLEAKAPLFFEHKREELSKLKRDAEVDLTHTLALYHEVRRDLNLNLPFRSHVPYKSW